MPDSQVGGIIGWLLTKQSEFYRAMSATIRAAKSDGSAVWTLLAISFAYGIFHAAGPGHGKAVISSYLVANEETAKRGIVLSFVSALMQALVAVLIVGIGAWLLNVTAKTMRSTERWVEIASYGLIAAFGARLVWTKGRGFVRALRPSLPAAGPQLAMAHASASAHTHDHGHDHHHHEHAHGQAHAHAHAHTAHAEATASAHAHHDHSHHDHVHDEHCGHSHGPTPDQLAGPGGWARGLVGGVHGGHPAVFRRDPRAGLRAGAGDVLGRHRCDFRDGPGNARSPWRPLPSSPSPPRASPAVWPVGAMAVARW